MIRSLGPTRDATVPRYCGVRVLYHVNSTTRYCISLRVISFWALSPLARVIRVRVGPFYIEGYCVLEKQRRKNPRSNRRTSVSLPLPLL
jgi:hypothetical protein